MHNNLSTRWQPANPESSLQSSFRVWAGLDSGYSFALLAINPIVLLVYILFVSSPESAQHRGIDLSNYLSNGSLLVMVFTTFWFFRYTRLGKRIADPELCPPQSSVLRNAVDAACGAGCLGIFLFHAAAHERDWAGCYLS